MVDRPHADPLPDRNSHRDFVATVHNDFCSPCVILDVQPESTLILCIIDDENEWINFHRPQREVTNVDFDADARSICEHVQLIRGLELETNLAVFNEALVREMIHRRVPPVLALRGSLQLMIPRQDLPLQEVHTPFFNDVLFCAAFPLVLW